MSKLKFKPGDRVEALNCYDEWIPAVVGDGVAACNVGDSEYSKKLREELISGILVPLVNEDGISRGWVTSSRIRHASPKPESRIKITSQVEVDDLVFAQNEDGELAIYDANRPEMLTVWFSKVEWDELVSSVNRVVFGS